MLVNVTNIDRLESRLVIYCNKCKLLCLQDIGVRWLTNLQLGENQADLCFVCQTSFPKVIWRHMLMIESCTFKFKIAFTNSNAIKRK